MSHNKLLKTVIFILLLAFLGSFLSHKIELPAADDIARHVKNGELILQGKLEVLHFNFYSYTEPNHAFANHHWLSGVIFYLLFQAVGWSGLVIFKISILLSTFCILFWTAIKKSNFWLVAFFSLPTILILGERTYVRPEIFSYLFVAVFLYLLSDLNEHPERKRIFWLIPVQALWVNMHLFFIVGVALVGGFLLEKIILNRKNIIGNSLINRLGILLMMLIVVCFVNPNGIAGALYPLEIFNNYGMGVGENQPPSYFLKLYPPLDNLSIVFFEWSVLLLAISFIFNLLKKPLSSTRDKPIFYFLASATTALAGFFITRSISFFGLFFLPIISANFNRSFARLESVFFKKPVLANNLRRIFIAIPIVSLCYLIFLGGSGKFSNYNKPGVGLTSQSNNSAAFFKEQHLRGPIFNDYDVGSYLIYHLYPKEKVFVDNRPEAYSTAFFEDVYLPMLTDESVWQKKLEKYDFNTIFMYQYNDGPGVREFMFRRIHDSSWALVYADSYAIILVKNNQSNHNIIKKFQINPENAELRLEHLVKSEDFDDQVAAAGVFNLLGRIDLGAKTFLKVVDRWPKKGKIWMVLGEMESNDNPRLAITYLEKAIGVGYKIAEAYSFLGLAYAKVGDYDNAILALQKALKINPDREDAKELLRNIQSN